MSSKNFFASKRAVKPANATSVKEGRLTEDQLGELVRDACKQLGWHFLWLRKTIHSSEGILDTLIVRNQGYRHLPVASEHILHRELKGFDRRGRLRKATDAQLETIDLINAAGGNAALWVPADWFSGKILEELR